LQSGATDGPKDTSHRQAVVADLLWHLQVAHSSKGATSPTDVADDRPAGYS
jgi:hypothetical protein